MVVPSNHPSRKNKPLNGTKKMIRGLYQVNTCDMRSIRTNYKTAFLTSIKIDQYIDLGSYYFFKGAISQIRLVVVASSLGDQTAIQNSLHPLCLFSLTPTQKMRYHAERSLNLSKIAYPFLQSFGRGSDVISWISCQVGPYTYLLGDRY